MHTCKYRILAILLISLTSVKCQFSDLFGQMNPSSIHSGILGSVMSDRHENGGMDNGMGFGIGNPMLDSVIGPAMSDPLMSLAMGTIELTGPQIMILDNLVKTIVGPDAKINPAMMVLLNTDEGFPTTSAKMIPYITILQCIAKDLQIKVPGIQGKATREQIEDFIFRRSVQWMQSRNMFGTFIDQTGMFDFIGDSYNNNNNRTQTLTTKAPNKVTGPISVSRASTAAVRRTFPPQKGNSPSDNTSHPFSRKVGLFRIISDTLDKISKKSSKVTSSPRVSTVTAVKSSAHQNIKRPSRDKANTNFRSNRDSIGSIGNEFNETSMKTLPPFKETSVKTLPTSSLPLFSRAGAVAHSTRAGSVVPNNGKITSSGRAALARFIASRAGKERTAISRFLASKGKSTQGEQGANRRVVTSQSRNSVFNKRERVKKQDKKNHPKVSRTRTKFLVPQDGESTSAAHADIANFVSSQIRKATPRGPARSPGPVSAPTSTTASTTSTTPPPPTTVSPLKDSLGDMLAKLLTSDSNKSGSSKTLVILQM